jgi:hypothetical protein
MNKALTYSQQNPAKVRALAEEGAAISSLPNLAVLLPNYIDGGKTLQGTMTNAFVTLRQDGKIVTGLRPGKDNIVLTDASTAGDVVLLGPGVDKKSKGTARVTWAVTLKKGKYTYASSARAASKRTITVS